MLDNMVTPYLAFRGTAKLFSIATVPFHIFHQKCMRCRLLYILINIYSYLSFIIPTVVSVSWCFIVILTFISIMTNDLENLSCIIAIFVFLFGETSIPILCLKFLNWSFYWVISILCILNMSIYNINISITDSMNMSWEHNEGQGSMGTIVHGVVNSWTWLNS